VVFQLAESTNRVASPRQTGVCLSKTTRFYRGSWWACLLRAQRQSVERRATGAGGSSCADPRPDAFAWCFLPSKCRCDGPGLPLQGGNPFVQSGIDW